ncbi:MAG: hypothetical protein N2654_07125 [Deltaproteobacteria bacterium]|nr:hypothetical protein [Deltaproteobacteria bacterium]
MINTKVNVGRMFFEEPAFLASLLTLMRHDLPMSLVDIGSGVLPSVLTLALRRFGILGHDLERGRPGELPHISDTANLVIHKENYDHSLDVKIETKLSVETFFYAGFGNILMFSNSLPCKLKEVARIWMGDEDNALYVMAQSGRLPINALLTINTEKFLQVVSRLFNNGYPVPRMLLRLQEVRLPKIILVCYNEKVLQCPPCIWKQVLLAMLINEQMKGSTDLIDAEREQVIAYFNQFIDDVRRTKEQNIDVLTTLVEFVLTSDEARNRGNMQSREAVQKCLDDVLFYLAKQEFYNATYYLSYVPVKEKIVDEKGTELFVSDLPVWALGCVIDIAE